MQVIELEKIINEKLHSEHFHDYAPNGIQVLGRPEVKKIVTGVTACQHLLDKAVALNADAVLVHHGYFWKNEPTIITGIKQKRLKTLLSNDINLLSYHLPLDAHPELGNNAKIAEALDVELFPRDDERELLFIGRFKTPVTSSVLTNNLEHIFNHPIITSSDEDREIGTIAFCSGAGQDYIDRAAAVGIDAFLTGEVSERTIHSAREYGVHFFAAGHHATERAGIAALGKWLSVEYGLNVIFIDIDNPA